ncbi:uncharacterized protein TRIADDRAFT_62968, partial [Trichoplax adhaerens]
MASSNVEINDATQHFILGDVADLPTETLPTKKEVLLSYLYIRNQIKLTNNRLLLVKKDKMEILDRLAYKVVSLWNRASIPCLSLKNVKRKILTTVAALGSFSKINASQRLNTLLIASKKQSYDRLFDICRCKCLKKSFKKEIDPLLFRDVGCRCSINLQPSKWEFYIDQCTIRKMIIESKDAGEMIPMQQIYDEKKIKWKKKIIATATDSEHNRESSKTESPSSESDVTYCSRCNKVTRSRIKCNKLLKYPRLAAALYRFDISPHVASV